MTKEQAEQIVGYLRTALSQLELALGTTTSLSNREHASSLNKTLKSTSADIVSDALAPIFQLYPELRPESLSLDKK